MGKGSDRERESPKIKAEGNFSSHEEVDRNILEEKAG